jgi:SAM-dependent methyltransferase
MKANQRFRRSVVAQFHNPTGVGGHLAGWIMSHRRSNLARSRWAVDLLDIQPDERVLELGCGPGVALAAIADRIVRGVVVGVDHSPVMIRQARRRNAAAVAAGRVQLVCAAVEDLLPVDRDHRVAAVDVSPLAEPFHAALAVNNVGFWDQPDRRLAALQRLMQPGGRVALVTQPRCPGATLETSRSAAAELAGLLDTAGYTGTTSVMLDLDPPAVCVRATVTVATSPR